MSGCCDILGRLFSNLQKFNISKGRQNLEHPYFIAAIEPLYPELFKVLQDVDTLNWIHWLKERRNFVAHAGSPSYSDILRAKDTPLTPSEITDRMNRIPSVQLLLNNLQGSAKDSIIATTESIIRMHEDNTVDAKDAMVIRGHDFVEKRETKKLFFSLKSVKADYMKFSSLVNDVTDQVA